MRNQDQINRSSPVRLRPSTVLALMIVTAQALVVVAGTYTNSATSTLAGILCLAAAAGMLMCALRACTAHPAERAILTAGEGLLGSYCVWQIGEAINSGHNFDVYGDPAGILTAAAVIWIIQTQTHAPSTAHTPTLSSSVPWRPWMVLAFVLVALLAAAIGCAFIVYAAIVWSGTGLGIEDNTGGDAAGGVLLAVLGLAIAGLPPLLAWRAFRRARRGAGDRHRL